MAEIDDRAFKFMQQGDPDKYITGGAVEYSEYEMDMSPTQQEDFMRQNTKLFQGLYNIDPLVDREKLPFSEWLEVLSPERIKLLADDYGDPESKAPRDPEVILSKDIMNQAGKHWGGEKGFKFIKDMVLGFPDGPIGEGPQGPKSRYDFSKEMPATQGEFQRVMGKRSPRDMGIAKALNAFFPETVGE
jgi:hypothetical protein|tara:strand:+ start:252 stop:815 length:564 start_codon:yes stop_codon:yes gene_type:complete